MSNRDRKSFRAKALLSSAVASTLGMIAGQAKADVPFHYIALWDFNQYASKTVINALAEKKVRGPRALLNGYNFSA